MADVTLYYELLPYTSEDLTALIGAPATVEPLAPAPVCVVCDETMQETVDVLMERKGYFPTGAPTLGSAPANYRVETLLRNGRVDKIEFYRTDNGDGTYTGLYRLEQNNWQGSTLMSVDITEYAADGVTITRSWTEQRASNPTNNTRITKGRS